MVSSYTGNLVGHTLGSRFRLTRLVGSGASARVYLAEDIRLRRRVAVKLLHSSLSEDDAFLRRFQREAEVLAPLSHQNIVIIHDINYQENALGEPPYLVTEYLAGGSLRNLLDTGFLLSDAQAVVMGLGAARGLQFAHDHGLVHRDIKPANLLFGDDQRVRISDFGLARALAENGRTEPYGALVGTIRYVSPEQAAGRNLDGRSDVYSLALVIWESVLGELPFAADTLSGTAMARMHTQPVAPPELGALGLVLEQALRIEPADRLDAAGLAHELESLGRRLPAADPLPLDGTRLLERAADLEPRDPTMLAVGSGPRRADAGTSESNTSSVFDVAVVDPTILPPGSGSKARGTEAPETSRRKRARAKTSRGPRAHRLRSVLLAALVIAVVGSASAATLVVLRRTPTHLVPTLEGLTLEAATQAVSERNFTVVTTPPLFSDDVAPGVVLEQEPPAGTRQKEQTLVRLTLSKGREPVDVPVLAGKSYETAAAVLTTLGLRPTPVPGGLFSETVPEGAVMDWSPKGPVAPGTFVAITVSKGPEFFELPKTRGLSPVDARALLPTGVVVTEIETFSDLAKGLATGTEPKSGSKVRAGDQVKLFISKGPNIVTVPNVIGLSVGEATAIMKRAGLPVAETKGSPDLPVKHTRPIRRQRVKSGTRITLYTTSEGVPEVPGITDRVATTKPASAETKKSKGSDPDSTDPDSTTGDDTPEADAKKVEAKSGSANRVDTKRSTPTSVP